LYSPLLRSKYTRSDEDIKPAVDLWCDDAIRAEAEVTYGHISLWKTSNVTSMTELFRFKRTFNDDISAWDVTNVTNMSGMFGGASAFNSDLSAWNVTSVTDMSFMFLGARAFNSDPSAWAVSDATDIVYMFVDCPLANDMKPARCRN
jgi:surface protein